MSRTRRSNRWTKDSRKTQKERELRFEHWVRGGATSMAHQNAEFERLFEEAMAYADEMFYAANPDWEQHYPEPDGDCET